MIEFFIGFFVGGIFWVSFVEAYKQGYLDWFKKEKGRD